MPNWIDDDGYDHRFNPPRHIETRQARYRPEPVRTDFSDRDPVTINSRLEAITALQELDQITDRPAISMGLRAKVLGSIYLADAINKLNATMDLAVNGTKPAPIRKRKTSHRKK